MGMFIRKWVWTIIFRACHRLISTVTITFPVVSNYVSGFSLHTQLLSSILGMILLGLDPGFGMRSPPPPPTLTYILTLYTSYFIKVVRNSDLHFQGHTFYNLVHKN